MIDKRALELHQELFGERRRMMVRAQAGEDLTLAQDVRFAFAHMTLAHLKLSFLASHAAY